MADCSACGVRYPLLDGVPVLLRDAESALQRFRLRLRDFVADVERGIEGARTELARPDLLSSTRRRIESSCTALADNRRRIVALLEDAGLAPAHAHEGELYTTAALSPAGEQSITAYYDQMHRDWGWPDHDAENQLASARVVEAIGEVAPGALIVVLGAGAGRLAYDVHHAFSPRATYAVDINPLLMIVLSRIARGESVSLDEFPFIPRDFDHIHVARALRAPQGAVSRLFPVVADAFDAPIVDGAADLVITPWFLDQVPSDARDAIGVVHRLLRPGGRWINHGPLIYPKHRSYAMRFTALEIAELIDVGGFALVSTRRDMTEFLRSPAAGFGRIEQVHTFAADKRESAEPSSWLLAPHFPVPRFAGLDGYEAPDPFVARVAAMIDGRTSLATITARMVSEHAIAPTVAKREVPAAALEIARATGGAG